MKNLLKTLGLICLFLTILFFGVKIGHIFLPGVKQDINYWFGIMGACWVVAVIGNTVYEIILKIFSPFREHDKSKMVIMH